jgi:hypothetical protein
MCLLVKKLLVKILPGPPAKGQPLKKEMDTLMFEPAERPNLTEKRCSSGS